MSYYDKYLKYKKKYMELQSSGGNGGKKVHILLAGFNIDKLTKNLTMSVNRFYQNLGAKIEFLPKNYVKNGKILIDDIYDLFKGFYPYYDPNEPISLATYKVPADNYSSNAPNIISLIKNTEAFYPTDDTSIVSKMPPNTYIIKYGFKTGYSRELDEPNVILIHKDKDGTTNTHKIDIKGGKFQISDDKSTYSDSNLDALAKLFVNKIAEQKKGFFSAVVPISPFTDKIYKKEFEEIRKNPKVPLALQPFEVEFKPFTAKEEVGEVAEPSVTTQTLESEISKILNEYFATNVSQQLTSRIIDTIRKGK